MPLKLIRADITTITCDAIVNAANHTLLGGGGVDGAIHRAAGSGLLAECMTLGGCRTGEAKTTGAYNLPCKYVIHTVGPVWHGGIDGEEKMLRSCYRNSLAQAKSHDCESVAFPLISSGVYGYPKEQAFRIAVEEITAFLMENDMLVYIVIFDSSSYQISKKLFDEISAFIDDKYVDEHVESSAERFFFAEEGMPDDSDMCFSELDYPVSCEPTAAPPCPGAEPAKAEDAADGKPKKPKRFAIPPISFTGKFSIYDALGQIDESFSEMLLRKIDEKGMTDAECYKKANIDRKLFSKIRSNRLYKPSKATAIAFCIALELSLDETKDMLMKAGYALSRSNKFDIIIEYFIINGNYNIFEINEALFSFDQSLLGA